MLGCGVAMRWNEIQTVAQILFSEDSVLCSQVGVWEGVLGAVSLGTCGV